MFLLKTLFIAIWQQISNKRRWSRSALRWGSCISITTSSHSDTEQWEQSSCAWQESRGQKPSMSCSPQQADNRLQASFCTELRTCFRYSSGKQDWMYPRCLYGVTSCQLIADKNQVSILTTVFPLFTPFLSSSLSSSHVSVMSNWCLTTDLWGI